MGGTITNGHRFTFARPANRNRNTVKTCRAVTCVTTNKDYRSITEAAQCTGISTISISNSCIQDIEVSGLQFKYSDNE